MKEEKELMALINVEYFDDSPRKINIYGSVLVVERLL